MSSARVVETKLTGGRGSRVAELVSEGLYAEFAVHPEVAPPTIPGAVNGEVYLCEDQQRHCMPSSY